MSPVYSATKGAVDTVTRSLTNEFGPRNIRVNAINPSMVEGESCPFFVISVFFESYKRVVKPIEQCELMVLTALSVIAALKKLSSPLAIGT